MVLVIASVASGEALVIDPDPSHYLGCQRTKTTKTPLVGGALSLTVRFEASDKVAAPALEVTSAVF